MKKSLVLLLIIVALFSSTCFANPNYLDKEDQIRLQDLAGIVTSDINQTLAARERASLPGEKWSENNPVPLLKDFWWNTDPTIIRIAGATALIVLADRWANMQNPIQRKIEILALLYIESSALKYSMEHDGLKAHLIPEFRFTLWSNNF